MKAFSPLRCALIAAALASIAAVATAASTIQVSASESAPQKAQFLRAAVTVIASGDDATAAIADLSRQRQRLKTAMLAAGADPKSLVISDPVLANSDSNLSPRQRIILQMQGNQNPPPTSHPSGVSLSCSVTADWPMAAPTADDAMTVGLSLENKIKSALPAPAAASPEDEEIAEEQAARQQAAGVTTPAPGQPQFTFVHKLSDADRAALLDRALADARDQAALLAKAAGQRIIGIDNISTAASSMDNVLSAWQQMAMDGTAPQSPGESEATGSEPNAITYGVTVNVTFAMEEGR